jgi:hypothetical protein
MAQPRGEREATPLMNAEKWSRILLVWSLTLFGALFANRAMLADNRWIMLLAFLHLFLAGYLARGIK